ncbi:hypothetical protein PSTG_01898 [Puccinia striiformis f. sp. tritici PST-78]|uniref:Uncharacterized protein n=1 Tax=Puccinia striiformis f. sp. tritici PST-78 TaxID=1165861 RepID=A0A0L0VZZ6_9BASI|nr:hypothetical protein PSTG_01898 [Puccinia striiformis f. sp. tritici PST-78]
MSDSEASTMDPEDGADLVLAELEVLREKYNTSMKQATCARKEEFTEDDLKKKEKLLDQLRPSLLAVKHEVTQFLAALGLLHSHEDPTPNFEWTLEVIANIDRFFEKTIDIIESVTIKAPVPHETHDHRLKRCKYFRSHGLRVDIHRLGSHMYSLSWYCIYFINAWKLSNRHPNSLTYRSTTTARGGDLAMNAAYCIGLSTVIIRKSEASDFSILQKEWAKIVTHLDRLLQLLIDLSYYTYDNRTLYNHISNTTTKKILFTLDSEINSETLSLLYTRSAAIRIQLENHVDILLESYEENRMGESRAEIRDLINQIARTVESTVVLLALYIIPLSPKVNRMSLQSDFKTWLFVWEGLWHTAKNNFLDALASSA